MRQFLTGTTPPIIMAFTGANTQEVISRTQQGMALGAEGFCLQTCYIGKESRTRSDFRKMIAAAEGMPVYVTNYRHFTNEGTTDEELAQGILELAGCGATLCDVMGDLFDPQPEEMTYDMIAVEKQKALISQLHQKGVQALMSAHIYRFLPAQEVLKIALSQQARGADIVKIVTYAETEEQETENLKTTALLKKELAVPFLFLSNGISHRHRHEGPSLGSCMYLGCLDDTVVPKPSQPSIASLKSTRENRGNTHPGK